MPPAPVPTASLLGTRPLRVVLVGGDVLRDELTCVGPVAVATLERYHFDVAVVGAAGLTARWGITELNEGEAEVQRRALARADRVVVITAGPGTVKAEYTVDLPRPRNIQEVRFVPRFVEIYEEIWNSLKDEVLVSYERTKRGGQGGPSTPGENPRGALAAAIRRDV